MITFEQIPVGHPGRSLVSGDTTWFALQLDRRFSYGLHVPASFAPGSPHPVVVVVHSTSRRAQDLRSAWAAFSEQHRAVVLAPLFPAGMTGDDDIDSYKGIEDAGLRFDRLLFAMLEEVAARWGVDVARFYLTGHSGGGQFTARMLLLHPDRVAGAAVSAPGRVTLIDPNYPWPRGTADTQRRFGIDVDADAVAAVPTLLTIGEHDAGTDALAWQADPSQEAYGSTRTERLETLAANLRLHGSAVRVEVVPGAGHQGDPTFEPVQRFISGLITGTGT